MDWFHQKCVSLGMCITVTALDLTSIRWPPFIPLFSAHFHSIWPLWRCCWSSATLSSVGLGLRPLLRKGYGPPPPFSHYEPSWLRFEETPILLHNFDGNDLFGMPRRPDSVNFLTDLILPSDRCFICHDHRTSLLEGLMICLLIMTGARLVFVFSMGKKGTRSRIAVSMGPGYNETCFIG